jgi:hypothetical protein
MNGASDLRLELTRIVEAVTIVSSSSFLFAGQPSSGLAVPMMGLQLAPAAPPLVAELTSRLYQTCFTQRFTGRVETPEQATEGDPAWMEALSHVNQSRERWEDGWQTLQSMPNGQVIARRGAVTRMLAPGEFVNLSGAGMVLPPGAAVRVYVPGESRAVQPGYYFAFGETLADSSDESSVVRFYWNVSAEGAAELLQLLSAALNRWQTPFRFKTGAHPAMLVRCDSAVLYVPRRHAPFVYQLAREIRDRVRRFLRPDVPLFTLRLGDGLAFADDPGTSESFGMSRCRMLAQGLWAAHQETAPTVEKRLEAVERQFRSEGFSLERPWLNAGLAEDLGFTAATDEAA